MNYNREKRTHWRRKCAIYVDLDRLDHEHTMLLLTMSPLKKRMESLKLDYYSTYRQLVKNINNIYKRKEEIRNYKRDPHIHGCKCIKGFHV